MADPTLVKRLAAKLRETSESTPKGEEFWPTLAQVAADETARTITVSQAVIPPDPFLAVVKRHEGFVLIARADLLANLQPPVEAYFQEGGGGPVWCLEIKKVLRVT